MRFLQFLKFFSLCLIFTFLIEEIKASHLNGGGFEITHLEGSHYRVDLYIYMDEHTGVPDVIDSYKNITANIFSKETNELIDTVELVKNIDQNLIYGDTCVLEDLKTRLVRFSATITLDSSVYNSPAGYYIGYEDCCRSVEVDNILKPDEMGIAFYLEFPPVYKGEQPFINSSPRLPELYDTYACLNQYYTINFGNVDPDGDSLVYKLVTPYRGSLGLYSKIYITSPAPYPLIDWRSGTVYQT